MKRSKLAIALMIFCTTTAFAADQMAKEETTPPAADGPISADAIPPISGEDTSAANSQPAAQPTQSSPPASAPPQATMNPNSSDSTNLAPDQAPMTAPAE